MIGPTKRSFKRITTWLVIDSFIILTVYTALFFIQGIIVPINYFLSLTFIVFASLVTLLSLYLFKVYYLVWPQTSGHDVAVMVYAVATATCVLIASNFIVAITINKYPLPADFLILSNILIFTGLVAVRYRSRLFKGVSWRWKAIWHQEFPERPINVLIIGAGESGQFIALRIKHRWQDSKHQIVGFIDDAPEKQGMYIEGCRVLGTRADIPRIVEQHCVDLIIIAIHNIKGVEFRDLLAYCEKTKARIQVVPDTYAELSSVAGVGLLRDVGAQDYLGRSLIKKHAAVDLSSVKNKVILVTGAAGSIGSELSRQLLSYNPENLILLDNNETGLFNLLGELTSQAYKLTPVLADITDKGSLRSVFSKHKPDVVFHAAAYKHVPMLELCPHEAVRVNIGGTWNLAQLASEFQIDRFVLISTDKAVNPSCVMGASKRTCELILKNLSSQPEQHTQFTSVRFGNVLGSNGSVAEIFERQIEKGGPVTVTHPEMTRYFMAIPEAVNLVIHAACLTKGGDLFMLKMGEEIRIVDLAERMLRMRGLRPYKDIEIKFTGIRPGEKLREALSYDSEDLLPTAHPGIVQLVDDDEDFSPSTFLEKVADLIAPDQLATNPFNELTVRNNGYRTSHEYMAFIRQLYTK